MEKKINLNFTCIVKSTCIKFLTVLLIVYIGDRLKLYSLPMKENLLLPFYLTHLFVTYFALILPLQYLISYYLHDLKVKIFINHEMGLLRIVNAKKIYDLKLSEVLKVTKIFERRARDNYFGFFYYKIETTMGVFYLSMLSSWTLEKSIPDAPYVETSTAFPFIN